MKILWRSKLQKMVVTGVMAALLAVLTQISIPLPTGIPVTLQTFVVALCGFLLGPGLGALSVGVYLALGAMGLPVFAGFAGGLASFAGMTGGYLWSFLPMACLCGLGARQKKQDPGPDRGVFGAGGMPPVRLFPVCPCFGGVSLECLPAGLSPLFAEGCCLSLWRPSLAAAAILRSLEKARLVTLV